MGDSGYGEKGYQQYAPQLDNSSYNQAGSNFANAFASQANPVADYWNGIAGQFSQPKNLQSDFDTAYDHATKTALGTANAQAAARGVYGSSTALNNVDSVAAQMAAQKANAQNQFTLNNSQNQLNYMTAGGQLANNAESSSLAKEAALVGQQMNLSSDQINRVVAQLNAGFSAQNAFQGREAQGFSQQDTYSQQIQQALQAYFAQLQGAANPAAGTTATAGATQNAVTDNNNQTAGGTQSLSQLTQLLAGLYSMGKSPQAPAAPPIPTVQAPTYPGQ